MMDFERSTQAYSWIFSEETLSLCREKAVINSVGEGSAVGTARVRKFASGFHQRSLQRDEMVDPRRYSPIAFDPSSKLHSRLDLIEDKWLSRPSTGISCHEQESLVRFHAHQIRKLLGPSAIYRGLVRNSSILATAVILLRRFYLSNSVVDFCPRKIAVSSAFLASKLEDSMVEVRLLQRATEVIEDKAQQSTSPYKNELKSVSLSQIGEGEREIMEGLNYELRCHHPHGAIKVLAKDVMAYFSTRRKRLNPTDYDRMEERDPPLASWRQDILSPSGIWDEVDWDDRAVYRKALGVAHNAVVFTDIAFLFPPGQIAFAAVSIASTQLHAERGHLENSLLDPGVREYLRARFPSRQEQDLCNFENEVSKIVCYMERCPDQKPQNRVLAPTISVCTNRKTEMKRAVNMAFRLHPPSCPTNIERALIPVQPRKRKDAMPFSTTPVAAATREKIAKVTFEI